MTVKELILLLVNSSPDYDVFVSTPDDTDDYFVDSIGINDTQKQVFIKTSQ